MSKRISSLLLFAVVLLGTATLCFGQATAVIRGTVADPLGAVVPQANVTARNVENGYSRSTFTTGTGLYNFANLPPGTYDVTVEKSGFNQSVARGVHINVGDFRDQNFKLALAGGVTEVTVTSEAPLIQTTRTDVSTVVDEKQVRDLPVTSNMGYLNGVSPSNDYMNLATTAPGVRFDLTGNLGLDVIGPGSWNSRTNLINVDGGNTTDQLVSGRDTLGASLDEVREFQVLTNNYNAEYGQAGGLVVNVLTKSGTNGFHGDAHAYFRGRNLSASNYFYNLGLVQQGIPIDGARRAPFQKQEWGFTVGGPFIKNRTFWFGSFEHTHQASPFTLTPPSGAVTITEPFDEYLMSVKLDHRLTTNNALSLRFNRTRQNIDNYPVQTPVNATPDNLTSFLVHDHSLNGSLISTITPHVVNEARVFWHRYFNLLPDKTTVPGVKFPNFSTGANFCCPQGGDQNRYQGIDNVTWTHGSHTIKTGVNISYFPYTSLFQQFHFGQYITDAAGTPTSFTFGVGPSKTFAGNDGGVVTSKDNIYGVYVQDTWRIKPNFTLNYGVRYDAEGGAFRGGSIRRPGVPGCFQGNGIIAACSSDYNNVQPRLGISWSPAYDSGPLGWLFGGPNKSVISASFAEMTQLAFLNLQLDSLNFDGANLLTVTTENPAVLASYPKAPPQSALVTALTPTAGPVKFGRVRPIANNLKNPEIRHANLSFRRALSNTTAIEFDYIGVFNFGQFGELDTNFPAVVSDPAHPGFFFLTNRPDPRFLAIRTNQNSRSSHYNGGIVTLQRRLASHIQFQTSYTFSKTLTSAEDFFGTSEPADPRNIRAELAPSQNDVRHLFNYSLVLDSTGLKPGSGFTSHLANNWALSFTGTVQSGRPYPISTGTAGFTGSVFPGIGSETQQRPNILPNGLLNMSNIAATDGTTLLVSPAGAALCNCPANTFAAPAGASTRGAIDSFSGNPVDFRFLSGNLGRNTGLGSGYSRLDISLSRGFQLGSNEQRRVEFKADAFNILNHTNFLAFNGNDVLNILPFGAHGCTNCIDQSTGLLIGRNGSALALKNLRSGPPDKNFLEPNWGQALAGIGNPVSADIPRQIQLSVRLRW